jgi:hypothetical protein
VFDDSAPVSGGNLAGAFTCAPPRSLNAGRLSQQEVFKHEVTFATGKRCTANAAGYIFEDGFRPGLDFDNLIQRCRALTRLNQSVMCGRARSHIGDIPSMSRRLGVAENRNSGERRVRGRIAVPANCHATATYAI